MISFERVQQVFREVFETKPKRSPLKSYTQYMRELIPPRQEHQIPKGVTALEDARLYQKQQGAGM